MTKVQLNFKKGLFTLTVKGAEAVSPREINKAIPTRYTVKNIKLDSLVGTVKREGKLVLFTATGSKVEYRLANPKGKDHLKGLQAGKRYRLSGDAREIELRNSKSKSPAKALQLTVSSSKEEKRSSR